MVSDVWVAVVSDRHFLLDAGLNADKTDRTDCADFYIKKTIVFLYVYTCSYVLLSYTCSFVRNTNCKETVCICAFRA